jgi:hypothetical protein
MLVVSSDPALLATLHWMTVRHYSDSTLIKLHAGEGGGLCIAFTPNSRSLEAYPHSVMTNPRQRAQP